MRKPRILLVNESSYLFTGFSTYGMEVFKRLHATGKYELCELGCYGGYHDHRQHDLGWKFVSNLPVPGNNEDDREYKRSKLNEFGAWKFEQACLDFRPDAVMAIRDWLMDEFLVRSPFRRYFHLAMMPTVDSEPVEEQWLAGYLGADSIHTYTDWGLEVLRRQSGGRMRLYQAAPPGADTEVFIPFGNKDEYKQSLGLPQGSVVIGTVMRNQKRKLFPDLIQTFARLLESGPDFLRQRAYLYLHTGYPDQGAWELPRLIREAGVGHRTLFTYLCSACGQGYPSFYSDVRSICRRCGASSAGLVHPSVGVGRDILARVYNLMDFFVQYASNEGFGMPMVEAASCGLPVLAVDYSAMSDVVRKVCGIPLKVLKLQLQNDSHSYHAIPDNDDLLRQMVAIGSSPGPVRQAMGWKARQGVLEHYTYERTASVWQKLFDSLELKKDRETWSSPARLHTPARNIPANLDNEDFVRWCIAHVSGRPDLVDSHLCLRLVRDLNWGTTSGGMGGLVFHDASALGMGLDKERKSFGRQEVLEQLREIALQQNHWEQKRSEVWQ